MKYARNYIGLGLLFIALVFIASSFSDGKDKKSDEFSVVKTNVNGKGTGLNITFSKGEQHNHPTFAVWLEDLNGNYLQSLYVTKSLATGIYARGQKAQGVWGNEPAEVRRPAALPYYVHKRGIKAPDNTYLPTPNNPVPDAYTGATPQTSFILDSKADTILTGKFRVLVEVNQPWDWNEYWNNTLYPDDINYKTSCQPALVYSVTIDLNAPMENYNLNPIGHSHYSGSDGKLYTDISTITTAFKIFSKIQVTLIH